LTGSARCAAQEREILPRRGEGRPRFRTPARACPPGLYFISGNFPLAPMQGRSRGAKGTRSFKEIIGTFPKLLRELRSSEAFTCPEINTAAPEAGIYVFYDEYDHPLYVGRTDRMHERLREHSLPSSTHTSATFAFLLAKEIVAGNDAIDIHMPRKDLERDPRFKSLYTLAKKRVSKMKMRAIEIPDPVDQTLFEVYAALELKAPYNDWENH